MSKILGVNISHNVSFAYFENGILKEYYEEDRFNKIKHFEPEQQELGDYKYQYHVLKKFNKTKFDAVVFASADRGHLQIELPIINHIRKQINHKKFYFNIKNHHIYHATCGYYFSKFNEAIVLVSDGGGERISRLNFRCLQSIFLINKKNIKTKYKYVSNKKSDYFDNFPEIEKNELFNNIDVTYSSKLKSGLKYLYYTQVKAGFNEHEEGQMMGIAAYKDKDTNLDKNILKIANKAQEETLDDLIELINKSKKYSKCKNIILSGGYHMNCSNNFKIVKKFPEYNFFVDPICHDGGTSVGAGYYYENYL